MLDIYVDGDACPVKAEIIRVAERYGLQVYLVSNGGLRPSPNPNIHLIIVASGPDIADDWIAQRASAGDIAITADILLAGRCLAHGATVLSPQGKAFTPDNIGNAIAGRALGAHLRELGSSGHNPTFTPRDRSQFLQALDAAIQKIKRD